LFERTTSAGRANIITSGLEHHANLVPWQQMAQRFALQIHIMPVDDKGVFVNRTGSGIN